MVLKNRNIQTINILFSSWALTLMVISLIMEEWVELLPKIKKNKISHSPWMMCCTAIWPAAGLEAVRMMLMVVLGLSFHINLVMGLQFTSMLPQNKCIHLTIAFLSFFTGFLLLCALVKYYLKLKQGQSVYFSSFKPTWVFIAACFTVILFLTCVQAVPPRLQLPAAPGVQRGPSPGQELHRGHLRVHGRAPEHCPGALHQHQPQGGGRAPQTERPGAPRVLGRVIWDLGS
ncbi:transmembrane protein 225-like isoform X2 [Dipodomys merriami]|uniref:transmembrane protein 225-like isoform X2 n=1 Tax=Dipodomys merriami TaxID=94247 RepID=UPI00384E3F0F